MKDTHPTEKVFLKDVANHSMKVLLDNGVYRHLQFKNNGSNVLWFDIVTWPGFLAYTGDMGCFVFSRLEDMFGFFRTDRRNDHLGINLSYWGEKLEAVDRYGYDPNFRKFSPEKFKSTVTEYVNEWVEEYALTVEQQAILQENIEEQILGMMDEGEYAVHQALRDFSCEIEDHLFEFCDTWEWDLREYTYRFIWCCYAIAWAIKKYDESSHPPVQPEV